MAITLTVHELRNSGGMRFSGTDDKMTIEWTREFRVEATATGGDVAEDVAEHSILTAPGIPVVNRSVYYRNGQIIPYVICRGKSCRPVDNKRSHWLVTATYRSQDANQNESSNEPQDPPTDLTDITPSEEPTLGEMERVLYQDRSATPKDIRLPSGNMFSTPVTELVPTLSIKITQYEPSITYEQMLDRKFKVNSTTYRGQAPGMWLIRQVEATEVDVVLSGGTVSAALVTYTVQLSARTYYNANTGVNVNAGWNVPLALIDNLHKDGNKWVPATIDDRGRTLFFVDEFGVKKANPIGGNPDYEEFQTQLEIDFNSFLQV